MHGVNKREGRDDGQHKKWNVETQHIKSHLCKQKIICIIHRVICKMEKKLKKDNKEQNA